MYSLYVMLWCCHKNTPKTKMECDSCMKLTHLVRSVKTTRTWGNNQAIVRSAYQRFLKVMVWLSKRFKLFSTTVPNCQNIISVQMSIKIKLILTVFVIGHFLYSNSTSFLTKKKINNTKIHINTHACAKPIKNNSKTSTAKKLFVHANTKIL